MARRRRRLSPGAWRAIVYAVLVHLAAIALFTVSLRWGQPERPSSEVIQAVAVPPQDAKPAPAPKTVATAAEREPAAEAQRRREEQARARAEAERQRQIAFQKKQEEERKRREAERHKAEAEKKRREEEEKRRAAEEKARKEKEEAARRQKQAEEALRAQLEAEERARAEAARRAQALAAADRYRALIRQKVERNWSRPAGARQGLECIVRVRLTPGGEVLEARVVRGSGDAVFDRSVESAVFKASPLPVPENREIFEQFRELEFIFKPQE